MPPAPASAAASLETISATPLDVGATGKKVTKLQKRLVKCGFLSKKSYKKTAGTYNENTRKAVAKAQKKMGYTSCDGDASIEFQAYIDSELGEKLNK